MPTAATRGKILVVLPTLGDRIESLEETLEHRRAAANRGRPHARRDPARGRRRRLAPWRRRSAPSSCTTRAAASPRPSTSASALPPTRSTTPGSATTISSAKAASAPCATCSTPILRPSSRTAAATTSTPRAARSAPRGQGARRSGCCPGARTSSRTPVDHQARRAARDRALRPLAQVRDGPRRVPVVAPPWPVPLDPHERVGLPVASRLADGGQPGGIQPRGPRGQGPPPASLAAAHQPRLEHAGRVGCRGRRRVRCHDARVDSPHETTRENS